MTDAKPQTGAIRPFFDREYKIHQPEPETTIMVTGGMFTVVFAGPHQASGDYSFHITTNPEGPAPARSPVAIVVDAEYTPVTLPNGTGYLHTVQLAAPAAGNFLLSLSGKNNQNIQTFRRGVLLNRA